MTRTRWIASIALPLSLLLALPVIAAAGTSTDTPTRHYSGTTAQGRPIEIKAVETADGWAIARISLAFKMRCEDSSSKFSRDTTRVFDPPIAVDEKHRFAIDDVSLTEALHVHGRLGANAATGTLEFNVPAFTNQEDLQVCSSGERLWTASKDAQTSPTPSP
ncbi:MAG: hypothetical protein ACJ76P_03755 [Actinomycetota bacterium]